jgi:hypothetical protein
MKKVIFLTAGALIQAQESEIVMMRAWQKRNAQ